MLNDKTLILMIKQLSARIRNSTEMSNMLTSSQIFKLTAPISSNGASQVALMVKNLPASAGHQFDAWAGKMPWRRAQPPTPVFLPGESRGQRSLAGHGPYCRVGNNWNDLARTHILSNKAEKVRIYQGFKEKHESHYLAPT